MVAKVYRLLYKKSVDKDLRKLAVSVRKQIVQKITGLAQEPRPAGSTKLKGATDLYRIRYSDYRIIYQIRDQELIVLVIKVGHRKEIYRDL